MKNLTNNNGLDIIPNHYSKNYRLTSKEFPKLNKEAILNATENGLKILEFIFSEKGCQFALNKNIRNPFYKDKNPSLRISDINGAYLFNDFGNQNYQGDVFDFAGFYYQLDTNSNFHQILERINLDLRLNLDRNYERERKEDLIGFKTMESEEISFWNQYGVSEAILDKYDVKSVNWFVVKTQSGQKRINNHGYRIYAYKVKNNSYKIYQPFHPKFKFSWVGQAPENYVFGYSQLDYDKDTVIITAGEKDALCLISLGYNAVCFNSETTTPDSSIINQLKHNFDSVLICFDNDETGRNEAKKISSKHSLSVVDISYILGDCKGKDIADYVLYCRKKDAIPDFLSLKTAISHAECVYKAMTNSLPKPFPLIIYELIPDLIKVPLIQYQSNSEKDMMLLSMLVILSGILPNYFTIYDKNKYESNLYLFVLGKPASGKGNVNDVKIIAQQIHDTKISKSDSGVKLTEKQLLFVPGNSSYASFLSLFYANDERIVLFETEADVFNDSKKQEWGNYSVALRQSFHHEPIAYSRKKDDEYYELKSPKLTCIMTGTPDQYNRFFTSPEDGLLSRFLLFNLTSTSIWKDVFDNSNKSDSFQELSKWAFKTYNYLKNNELEFCFNENQQRLFNETLRIKLQHYSEIDDKGYLGASIKRMGLIITRIGMILSILEYQDLKGEKVITCSAKIFECMLIMIENLNEHFVHAMMNLHDGLKPEIKVQLTQPEKLYYSLPNSFDRKYAIEIGSSLGITPDYVDKILKRPNLFFRVSRGKYNKVKSSAENAVL